MHQISFQQKITVEDTVYCKVGLLRPPIHFDRLTVIKKTG